MYSGNLNAKIDQQATVSPAYFYITFFNLVSWCKLKLLLNYTKFQLNRQSTQNAQK